MTKVYFIFDTPPLKSYYERYGMDYLCEKGIDVHVIDLSPIIHPDAYRIVTTNLIRDVDREIFFRKKSFKEYAKNIPDGAIFIITTDFRYDLYFVYKCIKKTQYYGYMNRMDTNVEPNKLETTARIKGLLNKNFFSHIRNSIFIRIPRKLLPIKAADFFFLGGTANKDEYIKMGCTDKHTKIIHMHSMDYEVYMKAKKHNIKLIKGKYCVFLDEYIPYHSDGIAAGLYVEPQKYYGAMRTFFYLIEKKYGIKVVIAVHPRASMEVCQKEYKGFELRQNKTAELIKDSEFVIAHFSTAISYAVLFYKPLILCMTNDLLRYREWSYVVNVFAELLGIKVMNITDMNQIVFPNKMGIDLTKYNDYIRMFIKADLEKCDEHIGHGIYKEICNIIVSDGLC